MARGRAAGYEDQRELILEHAARLFAERGYSATSMNEVARACALSKPALYHYFRDKYELLVSISESHVRRLHALADAVAQQALPPQAHLRALIECFVAEYEQAQHAHQVLVQDVKFLLPEDRERILRIERSLVGVFADSISTLWPHVGQAHLAKPTTMLLFGMMNWLFTWFKAGGSVSNAQLAPMVADVFFGGVAAVHPVAECAAPQGLPGQP